MLRPPATICRAAPARRRVGELAIRAEHGDRRLVRAADQPVWIDPETGYRRRMLSPALGTSLELVEIELPPGARVSFPSDAYTSIRQQVWVLGGRLHLHEGPSLHELDEGDRLQLGSPADCTFANPTDKACRHLVAPTRR